MCTVKSHIRRYVFVFLHFTSMIDASRLLFPLLLILVSLARPADAQQSDTPRKSLVRATLYSLAGTVGPVAGGSALTYTALEWESQGPADVLRGAALQVGGGLVAGGLIVGPAAGHLYANDRRQAGIGVGIRGGAVLVGVAASTIIFIDALLNTAGQFLVPLASESYEPSRAGRIARNVLAGAGIVVAVSALYDIATAPLSVNQYNETRDLRVRVVPQVHPSLDRVGLKVHLQF